MPNDLYISKMEKGVFHFKDLMKEVIFKFMKMAPGIDCQIECLLVIWVW